MMIINDGVGRTTWHFFCIPKGLYAYNNLGSLNSHQNII